jgi:hypothetical protein
MDDLEHKLSAELRGVADSVTYRGDMLERARQLGASRRSWQRARRGTAAVALSAAAVTGIAAIVGHTRPVSAATSAATSAETSGLVLLQPMWAGTYVDDSGEERGWPSDPCDTTSPPLSTDILADNPLTLSVVDALVDPARQAVMVTVTATNTSSRTVHFDEVMTSPIDRLPGQGVPRQTSAKEITQPRRLDPGMSLTAVHQIPMLVCFRGVNVGLDTPLATATAGFRFVLNGHIHTLSAQAPITAPASTGR